MNPIDIVITSWERKEMTERMIVELHTKTTTPHRIIVVDNGSKLATKNLLFSLYKKGLIQDLVLLEENRGLEPAKNIGLSLVRSELFISTDNDCLPMDKDKEGDWLGKLIALMNKYPDYAAISCRTQVMIGTGNIFDGHEEEDILEFPWPGGSLRIMQTNLVKNVGGWRSDMVSRGSEERFIGEGLRQLGYKTGFAVKVRAYHLFGEGNWGYGDVEPKDHGHNPVWHPAIQNGDNERDIHEWLKSK